MPEVMTEPIARFVWNSRYRLHVSGQVAEPDIHATWSRVALALSAPELHHRDAWRGRFADALFRFRFLPAGRILARAGSGLRSTLFNCFVMGTIHDSIDGIYAALGEAMLTMQAGGGVGCDFSTVRPAGMSATETGNIASGPLSFMHVWDQACEAMTSTGNRRGAMMATLRCDHPDIEQFIQAKRRPGVLSHFNLSVLVTDAFMRAVEEDAPWPLMFPLAGRALPPGAAICERVWSGSMMPDTCVIQKTVGAREVWRQLHEAAIECGDPGVIFIDRVQADNNLYYTETISTTNPCGEVPLPPYGACNLGSINLTQFVSDPFGSRPKVDLDGIAGTAAVATRMLDNVYDVSHFPLKSQERTARSARRIGLGITGLGDMLAMLRVRYGSDASIDLADKVMRTICHAAYRTSIALARERGVCAAYRARSYLEAPFVRNLPPDIVDAIRYTGIHNSHLTAIAPAGSISLLAGNVSSGMEPIYALDAVRTVREPGGTVRRVPVRDYAWALYRKLHGEHASVPACFVDAFDIDLADQLRMQATLQAHVDQSISKTVNLPRAATVDRYGDVFMQAYRMGLKGCTMFRPEGSADAVLAASEECGADTTCP